MGWLSGNTGGPQRQTAGWWRGNGRTQSLDPNRIRLRGGTINRRDVQRYRRNPNARATGGDPVCVVRLADGSLFAREGAHRITAARESGRRVRALVVDEAAEQHRRSRWW